MRSTVLIFFNVHKMYFNLLMLAKILLVIFHAFIIFPMGVGFSYFLIFYSGLTVSNLKCFKVVRIPSYNFFLAALRGPQAVADA